MTDRIRPASLLAALGLGALLSPLMSSAATPNPPARMCVDAACVDSTTAAAPSGAIKWHPGNYAWYIPAAVNGVSGYRVDVASHRNSILSFIDSIGDESSLKGVQIVVYWKALEGDNAGDYSAGFAALDEILARLQKYNKRLMVSFQTVVFGNFAAETDVFPNYVIRDFGTSQIGFNGYAGRTARSWQKPTGDRIIALSKAYGERYNKHPNFEMITLGETALQVTDAGFSNTEVLNELKRLLPAARSHWPNTAIRVGANDLHPDPLMVDLLATCAQYDIAVGGPDVWPADVTQADRVFVGLDGNQKATYIDYRDQLPWAVEVQWQSYGGQFSISQLYNATVNGYTANNGFVMPSMKTKYLIWYVNEANGTAATKWSTGILPFIRSVNGAVHATASGCPKNYAGCNTN